MKKAIITGGTSGFGLAYSNLLKENDYTVITVATKAADKIIDLATLEGTHQLIEFIKTEEPNLIILNAGFGGTKPFNEYTEEDILRMQHINGTNKALVLREFFDDIKTCEKRFIVASSIAGKVPSPLMGAYSASKAYCSNLVDSLNGELYSQKIDNLIIDATPGNMNTKTQSDDVVAYAQKVLSAKSRIVFNNDIYWEVLKKPLSNWENFVTNSYGKKLERINDKKR